MSMLALVSFYANSSNFFGISFLEAMFLCLKKGPDLFFVARTHFLDPVRCQFN